jgi:hypothetical protein
MPLIDFYENRIVLIDKSREKLHVYMRMSNLVYITMDIQNKCIERNEMHILCPARWLLKSCCSPGNLTEGGRTRRVRNISLCAGPYSCKLKVNSQVSIFRVYKSED